MGGSSWIFQKCQAENSWPFIGGALDEILGVQGSIEKKTNAETHTQVGIESQLEVCTLPETNTSPLKMDGWNTIVSFCSPASSRVNCEFQGVYLLPSMVTW